MENVRQISRINKGAVMKYIDFVKQQIAVIKERDPAIKTNREVFLYPSFKAMLRYRKAHKLYLEGKYYKARKISQKTARQTVISSCLYRHSH